MFALSTYIHICPLQGDTLFTLRILMKQRSHKHLASLNSLTPPKVFSTEHGVQITKTKQKKKRIN